MDRYQWRQAFQVGHAEVDEQHRQIFALMGSLYSDILGQEAEVSVNRTLKELLNYTQCHFAEEEALMRQVGYPAFDAHKKRHDQLMERVWAMYSRNLQGDELGIELLEFLNRWLVNHILEEDLAIGRYLRSPQG